MVFVSLATCQGEGNYVFLGRKKGLGGMFGCRKDTPVLCVSGACHRGNARCVRV